MCAHATSTSDALFGCLWYHWEPFVAWSSLFCRKKRRKSRNWSQLKADQRRTQQQHQQHDKWLNNRRNKSTIWLGVTANNDSSGGESHHHHHHHTHGFLTSPHKPKPNTIFSTHQNNSVCLLLLLTFCSNRGKLLAIKINTLWPIGNPTTSQ